MQIGVVVPVVAASRAATQGWDAIELRGPELHVDDDAAFARTRAAVDAAGLPVVAVNFIVPPGRPIVGPAPDADLPAHLAGLADRCAALGARVAVLGSGGARRVPPGFDPAVALEQFTAFARLAGETLGAAGVDLAVEHLNVTETDLVTTVPDAVAVARAVGLPNVGVNIDGYHLTLMGEAPAQIVAAGSLVRHVQVAAGGRRPPGPWQLDLGSIFTCLAAIGYDGAVSAECSFDDFDLQGPIALAALRQASEADGRMVFEGETFYAPTPPR